MKKIAFFITLVILTAIISLESHGQIKVVDGDSLEQGNTRIRLIGIDAPEHLQYCYDKNSNKYRCGIKSTEYLQSLVDDQTSCTYHGKDRYDRYLGECFNKDGININKQMVKSGWAVSYDNYYNDAETTAKESKSGIWQGKFMRPELYRALNRSKDKHKKNKKI